MRFFLFFGHHFNIHLLSLHLEERDCPFMQNLTSALQHKNINPEVKFLRLTLWDMIKSRAVFFGAFHSDHKGFANIHGRRSSFSTLADKLNGSSEGHWVADIDPEIIYAREPHLRHAVDAHQPLLITYWEMWRHNEFVWSRWKRIHE